MQLPTLNKLNVKGKRVLLRLDLDVPLRQAQGKLSVAEDYRLKASVPTFKYLAEHGVKQVILLGHRGRPGGKIVENLSLDPVGEYLEQLLQKKIGREETEKLDIFMMENLRFNSGEEANDITFTKWLASQGDCYINDAFGASHRAHASLVALPKQFKSKNIAAGFGLIKEVEILDKVLEKPKKPVVFVLGGGKIDKALLVNPIMDHADWVLIGGVLPKKVKSHCHEGKNGVCVAAAHLTSNGDDITPDSAKNFAEIIKGAGTVVWNGPMGDVDNGFLDGTKIVVQGLLKSKAFKVIGGGDTIHIAQKLRILGRMNHVSPGGGAMLEFLAYGDLPGLAALRHRHR
ncbi:MAG: phosphoglycerate kinase [Candidatus Blackburnbacteria bacterium]|nr:phosphoglycerate kinase [Candidatus Blackburnbacteria bacterium]